MDWQKNRVSKLVESGEKVQKHKRRQLPRPLIVLKEQSGRPKTFFGYARNLSRGGMFISSVNPPVPGSRFRICFPRPDSPERTVSCDCEVVWNRNYSKSSKWLPGMGVKFVDLPESDAEIIDRWANSQE
ncbi:MAG: pilus assembly protein PilZ [Deltaproteobacteria bacterium]|nr:MAG: pilus assembly protein PilZ [Deltaproteobacteria bacterium]